MSYLHCTYCIEREGEGQRGSLEDNGSGLLLRCLLEMGVIILKCCFDCVLIYPDIYLAISPWASSSTSDSRSPFLSTQVWLFIDAPGSSPPGSEWSFCLFSSPLSTCWFGILSVYFLFDEKGANHIFPILMLGLFVLGTTFTKPRCTARVQSVYVDPENQHPLFVFLPFV